MRQDQIDAMIDVRTQVEEGEQAKAVLPVVEPVLMTDIEAAASAIETACAEGAGMTQMLHFCHQLATARRLGRMLLDKIEDGAAAKGDLSEMVQAEARQESAPAHVAES